MGSIASLIINVAANTGEMQKGFGEAQNRMRELQAHSKEMGSGLGSALNGASFATPFLIAGQQVVSVMKEIKQAEKEAAQFGMSGSELGIAKTLGGMGGGAAGAEAVPTALRHFQRELAGAAAGSEESRAKFEKLGISWQELSQVPMADAFKQLGQHVAEANSHLQRVQITTQLLGKDGAALLPALQKGSEGFDEAKRRAIATGKAFDEFTETRLKKFSSGGAIRTAIAEEGFWGPMKGVLAKSAAGLLAIKDMAIGDDPMAGVKAAQKAREEMAKTSAGLAEAQHQAEVAEKVEKTVQALQDEAAAASMDAASYVALKAARDGANAEQQQNLRVAVQQVEAAKEAASRAKEVQNILSVLGKEQQRSGKDDIGQLVADLKRLGASSADIDKAVDLKKMADFNNELKRANEQAADFTKQMLAGARAVGMNADQAKLLELQRQGANKEELLRGQRALDQKHAAELLQGLRTPEELSGEKQRGIIDLFNAGALKKGDARDLLRQELEKSTPEGRSPAALARGSSAEVSAITQVTRDVMRAQAIDKQVDAILKGNEIQQRVQQILEDIKNGLPGVPLQRAQF